MITLEQAERVLGQTMHTSSGDEIGKVGQVFLDDSTGQPEWATVSTGLVGGRESFVPLAQASLGQEGLTVPYDKDQVKNAPSVDVEAGHLSEQEEEQLYSYYGMPYSQTQSEPGYAQTGTSGTTSGLAGTGTATGTGLTGGASGDQGEMTLSEERLRVGTERVESGRVRLRKFVTTQQVSTTVPMTREEARIEREPIAAGSAASTGAILGDEEVEVVLREERPVAQKDVVATERVRVHVDQVTENVQVSDSVRKEHVEVVQEGVSGTGTTSGTTTTGTTSGTADDDRGLLDKAKDAARDALNRDNR